MARSQACNGQYGIGCDGWNEQDGQCPCGCHASSAPNFTSMSQVADFHGVKDDCEDAYWAHMLHTDVTECIKKMTGYSFPKGQ